MKRVGFFLLVIFFLIVPLLVSSVLFKPEINSKIAGFSIAPFPESTKETGKPLVVFTPPSLETPETSKDTQSLFEAFTKRVKDLTPEKKRLLFSSPVQPVRPSALPPAPTLTPQQIHNKIWPASYRESLAILQEQMVKAGILTGTEGYVFDSPDHEQDIYDFLDKSLDYGVSLGLVPEDQIGNLRHGIRVTLPQLISEDKGRLLRGGPLSLTPGAQEFVSSNVVADLFEGIKYLFAPKVAHALVWVTAPYCFKYVAPDPAPGFDLWAFCCNCGIHIDEGVPIPVPDCGPGGRGPCDIQLGCLNLICRGSLEGLWDGWTGSVPPGPTGICGCGP